MANRISLHSGSVLNGCPITFEIMPTVLTSKPSFHRVVVDVICGMSGGNYETLRQFEPVLTEGRTIVTDISSALRTFRDAYEYSAQDVEFPVVKFRLKVYDEYMTDGEVHPTEPIYYPAVNKNLTTIFGQLSDIARILSTGTRSVQRLSRKPSSMPQLACVGETLVYAQAYAHPQDLQMSGDMEKPTSVVVDITEEGAHTFGDVGVYVLPSSEANSRMEFRFINSFGVMESVSVPRSFKQSVPFSNTLYTVARRETFNKFSRSIVRKAPTPETWSFVTDPLDEQWLRWYLYEFLMSEHVWIKIGETWLPCKIVLSDDEITFADDTNTDMRSVSFNAELGINGSPFTMS